MVAFPVQEVSTGGKLHTAAADLLPPNFGRRERKAETAKISNFESEL